MPSDSLELGTQQNSSFSKGCYRLTYAQVQGEREFVCVCVYERERARARESLCA